MKDRWVIDFFVQLIHAVKNLYKIILGNNNDYEVFYLGIEIRIFEPVAPDRAAFQRVGITQAATSIEIAERLCEPGSFSITIPFGVRYADCLTRGRMILIDRSFCGLIEEREITADQGGQYIIVTGKDLKGLTENRITIPPQVSSVAGAQGYDAKSGTTETVMKHYVNVNMVNTPLQPKRSVIGLMIAPDLGRGVVDDKYISRHEIVADVLKVLGEAGGLGYGIAPDLETGYYIFDVIRGLDRSATQSSRPRIVFDIARKTVQSQQYRESTKDARNIFYTTLSGAEFADEALTIMYTRDGETEQSGIYRKEKHLTISANNPAAGEEYNELKRYALIEAESYRKAESFSCELMNARGQYRHTYFLGDKVTVQNQEWGIVMHPVLTAMETSYTEGGITYKATFGKTSLHFLGRLKKALR